MNLSKGIESLAVALSLAYTTLLILESVWAWPCALLSSGIFVKLVLDRKLLAETALHVFYLLAAVYGWVNWETQSGEIAAPLPLSFHLILILIAGVLVATLGWLLATKTSAELPYLDASTTVFSVLATVLMVQLVPENWLYWVAIDAVSAVLYFRKQLHYSALMFLGYTALSLYGYLAWT